MFSRKNNHNQSSSSPLSPPPRSSKESEGHAGPSFRAPSRLSSPLSRPSSSPIFRLPSLIINRRSSITLAMEQASLSDMPHYFKATDSTSNVLSDETGSPVRETTQVNITRDPSTGNKTVNQYMITRELGRGTFGKVKLAMDLNSGDLWAIKITAKKIKSRGLRPRLLQVDRLTEIAILKKVRHPNIVQLREIIDDPMEERMYLVLEYVDGGPIPWRELKTPLHTSKAILRDVLCGVEYLHYHNIIHRDIKPANLLWTARDKRVKISDFGVSVILADLSDEESQWGTAGSPAFFAPELCIFIPSRQNSSASLVNQISDGRKSVTVSEGEYSINHPKAGQPVIGKAIDMWAIGVTLFCLLFGEIPFTGDSQFQLFANIVRQPLSIPGTVPGTDENVPDELKELLLLALDKNPVSRITLSNFKAHPWITSDLNDPSKWFAEMSVVSEPEAQNSPDTVTEAEIKGALTLLQRVRSSLENVATWWKSSASSLLALKKQRSFSLPSFFLSSQLSMTPNVKNPSASSSSQSSSSSVGSLDDHYTENQCQTDLPPADRIESRDVSESWNSAICTKSDAIGGEAAEARRLREWNELYD